MRRSLATLAAASLAFGLVANVEEPTLPEPIEVSMFFHGAGDRYVDETSYELGGAPKEMDRTASEEADFDSFQLLNYAAGPNPNCAGNSLFPVWTGFAGEGTVVGDATVTFDVIASTGGDATVYLWKDVAGQACNEAYPTPAAQATVTLPQGEGTVEVTLPTDGLNLGVSLMVQIQPAASGPLSFDPTGQARVLYDGADYPAGITFTCQPDALAEGETADDATCLPF